MKKSPKYSQSYKRALNRLTDKLFQEAYARNWSWEEFADRAGLHPRTVIWLGEYITKVPQFRTLEMMAQALGGSLLFKAKALPVAGAKGTRIHKLKRHPRQKKRKLKLVA